MRRSIHICTLTLLACLSISLGLFGSAIAVTEDTARPVLSMIEKRHQNVVLQQWELSCAAAALATILRYQFGIPATERSVALGLINRKEYLSNPDLLRFVRDFPYLI